MPTPTVTAAQFALLHRVAADPDCLSSSDSRLAVSIYALRARGLLTTPSPFTYWRPSVTDAGHELLKHGTVDTANRALTDAAARRANSPTPTHRKAPVRRPAVRDTADVTPNIDPPCPDAEGCGRQQDRGGGATVLVRERLGRAHPLIGAARDRAQRRDRWVDTRRLDSIAHLSVSSDQFKRALLLLQAVVDEAVRRGHRINEVRSRGCGGGLGVNIDGHTFELVMIEETRRVDHQLTAAEIAAKARHTWSSAPRWDLLPTGRLRLQEGHDTYKSKLANDRVRWSIEDRLSQAVDELERRALEATAARHAEEQRQASRRAAWQAAMVDAEAALVEHGRVTHLYSQLTDRRTAVEIRALVAASTPTHDDHPAWAEWALAHADRIDPVACFGPPAPPVATPDALKPFLTGFNPYEPNRW